MRFQPQVGTFPDSDEVVFLQLCNRDSNSGVSDVDLDTDSESSFKALHGSLRAHSGIEFVTPHPQGHDNFHPHVTLTTSMSKVRAAREKAKANAGCAEHDALLQREREREHEREHDALLQRLSREEGLASKNQKNPSECKVEKLDLLMKKRFAIFL